MSVELIQAMGWYEYKKDKWKSTIRERYGHFQGYPICSLSLYRDKKDIKGKKEPSFRHDLSKCTNVELKGRRLDRNFCLKYTIDNIHYAIWLPNAKEQQLWYEAIFSCIKKPKKEETVQQQPNSSNTNTNQSIVINLQDSSPKPSQDQLQQQQQLQMQQQMYQQQMQQMMYQQQMQQMMYQQQMQQQQMNPQMQQMNPQMQQIYNQQQMNFMNPQINLMNPQLNNSPQFNHQMQSYPQINNPQVPSTTDDDAPPPYEHQDTPQLTHYQQEYLLMQNKQNPPQYN
eukprot:TRINITY_DN3257_c0_g1_i1.p1 TRINITY_DN3257_c0_g1~~TRINITY_DN3257_c0_g1_i1.p1  ORF type:complete len:284 (+),score=78.21 TRINITY_DN3257_c0_g1_i1:136-987(+)